MYPNDTFVSTNSTVSLVCTAFGAPSPSVTWDWSGGELTTNSSHYRVESRMLQNRGLYLVESVLHICGFSVLTEGTYSCTYESYVGVTTVTTQLALKGQQCFSIQVLEIATIATPTVYPFTPLCLYISYEFQCQWT